MSKHNLELVDLELFQSSDLTDISSNLTQHEQLKPKEICSRKYKLFFSVLTCLFGIALFLDIWFVKVSFIPKTTDVSFIGADANILFGADITSSSFFHTLSVSQLHTHSYTITHTHTHNHTITHNNKTKIINKKFF